MKKKLSELQGPCYTHQSSHLVGAVRNAWLVCEMIKNTSGDDEEREADLVW